MELPITDCVITSTKLEIRNRQSFNIRLRPRLRRNLPLLQCPTRRDRVQQLPGQFHIPRKKQFRPCPCPNQRGHRRHIQGKFRSAQFNPPPLYVRQGTPQAGRAPLPVSNQINLPATAGICNSLFLENLAQLTSLFYAESMPRKCTGAKIKILRARAVAAVSPEHANKRWNRIVERLYSVAVDFATTLII